MKFLPLVALLCAMMALSGAAALPEEHEQPATEEPVADAFPEEEEEPATEEPGESGSHVVKMSTCCPSGWTAINGRCFTYVPRNMTWAHAEKNCLCMGGHLASVHSAEDYHDIQRMILSATHGQQEAWLGASDAQQESYWFWTDGTKFLYSHWCPGEPNKKKNQHCLQMNYSGEKCWDDLSCTDHRPSVCAKQA